MPEYFRPNLDFNPCGQEAGKPPEKGVGSRMGAGAASTSEELLWMGPLSHSPNIFLNAQLLPYVEPNLGWCEEEKKQR